MDRDRVTITPKIARAIEDARLEQGLNQQDLGDWIGKTGSYISGMNTGKTTRLSRVDLVTVLDQLELDPAAFGIDRDAPVERWELPEDLARKVRQERERRQVEQILGWMLQVRELNEPG